MPRIRRKSCRVIAGFDSSRVGSKVTRIKSCVDNRVTTLVSSRRNTDVTLFRRLSESHEADIRDLSAKHEASLAEKEREMAEEKEAAASRAAEEYLAG